MGALLLAGESVTAPGASGLDMGASDARASPASESPARCVRARAVVVAPGEPPADVHDGAGSYIGARSDADTFTSA